METVLFVAALLACGCGLAALAALCRRRFQRLRKEENGLVSFADLSALHRAYEGGEYERGGRTALIYVDVSLQQIRTRQSNAELQANYNFLKKYLIAEICRRKSGMAANIDGNFLILTRDTSEQAAQFSRQLIESLRCYAGNNELAAAPEVTLGYYQADSAQVSFEDARHRALQACKIAKARHEICGVYEQAVGMELDKVESLERVVDQAIESDDFFLEFQPIVDMKSGAVIGGEVLSRLNDLNEGRVMPQHFLQAIGSLNCHSKFDYYVFEKVCRWIVCQTWRDRVKYLSVNFSRESMSEPDFADNLIRITDQYGVRHSIIAVEITEEEQSHSDEIIVANINRLQKEGFQLFLDDFGTGFTSFADLQDFGIDVIKIDKTILDQANGERGNIIFSEIVNLAKQLGCVVLCEGMETATQAATARAAGCDLGQGFFYSPSLPAEDFGRLFSTQGESSLPKS